MPIHESAPYIALLHGGPGSSGPIQGLFEMLQPHGRIFIIQQAESTITDLLDHMLAKIKGVSDSKWILIGHSWGAWLAGLFAAKFPERVMKVILIGSGPLENKYTESINKSRLQRLSPEQKPIFKDCLKELQTKGNTNLSNTLAVLQNLTWLTDNFQPLPAYHVIYDVDPNQFMTLSSEIGQWRIKGTLLHHFQQIRCPVISIHGDYDPHPVEGIAKPMSNHLNFVQHIIPYCGHTPWIEEKSRMRFEAILAESL